MGINLLMLLVMKNGRFCIVFTYAWHGMAWHATRHATHDQHRKTKIHFSFNSTNWTGAEEKSDNSWK